MTSVMRSVLPSDDGDSDYRVDYSFAIEYNGPPVSHEIPQVVPLDVGRIPTASVADSVVVLNNLSIPVIQPIVRRLDNGKQRVRKSSKVASSSGEVEDSCGRGELVVVEGVVGRLNALDGGSSRCSSGTLGFSDGRNDPNQLSESSEVEDLDDEFEVSYDNSLHLAISDSRESTSKELTLETSPRGGVEYCVGEPSGHGNRVPVVTFRDLPSTEATSDGSDFDEPEGFPERPVLPDMKKGLCYRCKKKNRFSERELCVVCGAKYCSKCVLRAMGSMPEGRKCIACIGYRIDESKRGLLGKCSGMLKKLLTDEAIKQVMKSEISCGVNQLPPHLIYVNDKALSLDELVTLQNCPNPPKKLKPGRYWYDKVSGFWGKEGEKPLQIITGDLAVGYPIRQNASNGNTNVMINNREITKQELVMMQAAGIHCEGNPHFWVTSDGSYQLEGMNYVMGKLWEKKRVRLVCHALSLPFLSDSANFGENVGNGPSNIKSKGLEQKIMKKLLLVGWDKSGTSTIFKQAKILYDVPFSEDEKQSIKFMIQRNLYSYIGILLEGHGHFEEDYAAEMRRRQADEPGPSENSDEVYEKNIYSLSPRLKSFSTWLLQIMLSGNLEAIFPAATREYSPMVEELWKDKAFQATYKRRNELNMLPRVANYFLDRAVEISRMDYEPSEMDILYAEGISSSNGVAAMNFSFPKSSQDGYMEPLDQNEPSISYQLIRVHTSSLGENRKWLEMFEDVDLVIFCISLIEYDEYFEDLNGVRTNKMMATKKLFENIVTHSTLANKDFLLVLNKFDLLEEKIESVPLTQCEWFEDFAPVISHHPHTANSNNNPPLAQRAFHYMAVKFKRLFDSLTGRQLFVSRVTGLEGDSVDKVLRYGREILKWNDERHIISVNNHEDSTESMEASTSV